MALNKEIFDQILKNSRAGSWSYAAFVEMQEQLNQEPELEESPLTADLWQEFKRKFVESYGGETVRADGLTHTEFLRYLKDGYRENEEYTDEDWFWSLHGHNR